MRKRDSTRLQTEAPTGLKREAGKKGGEVATSGQRPSTEEREHKGGKTKPKTKDD